jgi:hypothetical protein
MNEGIGGNSGSYSGFELLKKLDALQLSGTLVLGSGHGYALLSLDQGKVMTTRQLGQCQLEQTNLSFHFRKHSVSALPLLESQFSQSAIPVMRAVPYLELGQRLPARAVDVIALLRHLAEEQFSGYLSLEKMVDRGLVLLLEGKLSAAYFESDGQLREASDALRGIRRLSVSSGVNLQFCALEKPLVTALLGLAFQREAQAGPGFNGLESGDDGYIYYHQGEALLQVVAELRGRSGRFASFERPTELSLPTEPPGWEQQHYQLTLRGRDALNPITELAMNFQSRFGRTGKRMLEQLNAGLTPEKLADSLPISLSDLRGWLERLEQEGLIRQLE